MELLLHYIWKHKLFPLRPLTLTDGSQVEVLSPGIHNTDAGPDFLSAKVKIQGIEWVGNVEIHTRTSDWYRHKHHLNPAYHNIILHIATDIDTTLHYPDGREIPQLQLDVPAYVKENYQTLAHNDCHPRCKNVIPSIPTIIKHNWLSALQVERLERRTQEILARRERLNKSWEDTFFVTIARSFGFGKNGHAFEQWATSIPMSAVGKHRDNLFQIEAIFFGQAGLLEPQAEREGVSGKSASADEYTYYYQSASADEHTDYYQRLSKEYRYLRQKFSLQPIDPHLWRFMRLRPQNSPHIRIAQLAMLYYRQGINLSKVITAASSSAIERLLPLLDTGVSDFWKTHYSFEADESPSCDKQLSIGSRNLIIINCIVPVLFAYGRYKGDQLLCQRAIDLWENIKPERNRIILDWQDAGISPQHAADSQALLQLHDAYCLKHECLRCRFGHEFIRNNPGFLCEKND